MSIQVTNEGIDVSVVDDREQWNRCVERSPHATPFHHWAALDVLADHAGATLYPLVGYKGQEPVGILPLFELKKGPLSAVFSPPPDLWVPYLGPALCNFQKLKRRKVERRHRRFVEGCLDLIESECSPRYTLLRTATRYPDVRPFEWNDYEITPRHTYVVDISVDQETLLSQFSSDARSNIRTVRDADCVVEEGGVADIKRTIEQVQARHDAQGETYLLEPSVVVDLYEQLPDGYVRPYACRVDGEFAAGMVTLEDDSTIYRWQGGAKPDVDLPVNDYIDWTIIGEASERGRTNYDLVGANNPRLCGYKAKFDPDLASYYSVQKGTRSMNVVSEVYKRFR